MNEHLLTSPLTSARAWKAALGASVLCFVTAPFASATIIILNEGFAADQRLTQNLPDTSAWYGNGTNLAEITGGIRLTAGASAHMLSYFTDSGAVSIPVGETMQITYQFRVEGANNAGGSIRVGVLNSGGSRISADDAGLSLSTFSAYTGYGVFYNPNTTSAGGQSIRERNVANNGLLHVATPWGTTHATGGSAISLADATDYTGVFSITRTAADAVEVSHKILSGAASLTTISHSIATGALTAFDTFAIAGVGSNAPAAIELYGVDITVVPEPSTYAAIAGLLTLGMVLARRRAVICKR